jgi:flagellar hook assembly protein FlgD
MEVTYRLSVDVVGRPGANVRVWDTVPAGLEFVGATPSPTPASTFTVLTLVTPGPTPGTGHLLVWEFPHLPAGGHTVSYVARVRDMTFGGAVIVNEAALAHPLAPTPQVTQCPLTVRGDWLLRVLVFNEAGEVVKTILVTEFSEPLLDVYVKVDDIIDSLHDIAYVYYRGQVIGHWDGTNEEGVPVTNGQYYVKIDNIDVYGAVESITTDVTVSRIMATVKVNVYNGAGELVRTLSDALMDVGEISTDVTLSHRVISPAYRDGNTNAALTITMGDGIRFVWDGRDAEGRIVPNGQYYVEVRTTDEDGASMVIVRDVAVNHGSLDLAGGVTAFPNPADRSASEIRFRAGASGAGLTLKVRVYDISGQLARVIQGPPGTGEASWDLRRRGVANGLYLAVVETVDPLGALERKVIKVMVLR